MMKTFLKLFLILTLGMVLAIASHNWFDNWFETFLYDDFRSTVLPSTIETSGAKIIDSFPSQLEQIVLGPLLFRGESCGAAIFNLSDKTLADIERSGLAYLQTSRQPPGGDTSYEYANWQETPIPKEWINKDSVLWSGLGCVNLDRSFVLKLYDAADSPGSYFTTNRVATLVVIPRLKVAVYSWWD